jgi:hypothetical protein
MRPLRFRAVPPVACCAHDHNREPVLSPVAEMVVPLVATLARRVDVPALRTRDRVRVRPDTRSYLEMNRLIRGHLHRIWRFPHARRLPQNGDPRQIFSRSPSENARAIEHGRGAGILVGFSAACACLDGSIDPGVPSHASRARRAAHRSPVDRQRARSAPPSTRAGITRGGHVDTSNATTTTRHTRTTYPSSDRITARDLEREPSRGSGAR